MISAYEVPQYFERSDTELEIREQYWALYIYWLSCRSVDLGTVQCTNCTIGNT